MQIKTYTDRTLPKALLKAKHEFGDEIVILESKEINNNPEHPGERMVQVIVGIDKKKKITKWSPPRIDADQPVKPLKTTSYAEVAAQQKMRIAKANEEQKAKREKKNASRPASPKPNKKKTNEFSTMISSILNKQPEKLDKEKLILDEISKLRLEIGAMNKKSQPDEQPTKRASAPVEMSEFPEPYHKIQEALKDKGVSDDLAYELLNQAFLLNQGRLKVSSDNIIDHIEDAMAEMLTPFNFKKQLQSKKQRVILLVGPTGVGKTTAAMKLAAHPQFYGAKKTTIVSTDPYGPSEALKAFARISDTDVYEEKDIDQTSHILEKYKSKDVIIVDTPGKSPFAPNQLEKLDEYVKMLKPTEIFLVLSVGADLKDLVLLCANYLLLQPHGIIFTKLDETTQPGKVFSILDLISLPVVCFNNGKKIFRDISPGNPEYMYNILFNNLTEEV